MRLPVIDNRRSHVAHGRSAMTTAADLEHELARRIDGEVRFSTGDRALYATDSSNYRQIPIGVVVPRNTDAVVAAVEVCREFDAPIVSRGGGTSLAGQCCNVAVVIDHSKYLNRVLDLDPDAGLARVEPGCVLDSLRDRAIKEHGLTFAPDPSTHAWCTLGGMLGNNSCGVHSVMAGRTSDCTVAMDVLTYDGVRMRVGATSDDELEARSRTGGREGEIYSGLRSLRDRYGDLVRQRYPRIPRRVSGYNLDDLLPENACNVAASLVGTEGTCAITLDATLKLVKWPEKRTIVVLGYQDVYTAGDHVPQIMRFKPIGLEGLDDKLIRHMKRQHLHTHETQLLPDSGAWLIVEFGADSQRESDERAKQMIDALQRLDDAPKISMVDQPEQEHHIWDVRESGLGATAFVKDAPDAWEGWEDAAVPPDRVGDYLRHFRKLLDAFGYDTVMYGHFGQGCFHCRINFDLQSEQGVRTYREFIEKAADLVVSFGGSISGEHGDGQSKAILLEKMFGPELIGAFREFKSLWDPRWKMNPGKVVDPDPPESNLRLGSNYQPRQVSTHFAYPDDEESFARATLRCVGVGKCRRNENAFMCPTYRVTMEEKHTTRGRAHLLFEMMRGDLLRDGWRDKAVHESLDLCIGCKGCRKDCPVHVDIATYKSEFLAHRYAHHLRPRAHYSMGLIGWWARAAMLAPGLANFFARQAPFSGASKWVAGVSSHRTLPRFAARSFTSEFRGGSAGASADPVLILPDVFNNVFYPDTLHAGARVLSRLGYRVIVPRPLPAPRPAIHYGMLRLAKRQLRALVDRLRDHARAGVPIVGFEPSTVAVLREELVRLLPQDQDARRICKLACQFSEFMQRHERDLPKAGGRAILHLHCHEKAALNPDATRQLLHAMDVKFEEPEPGCCGMAGSFGFERKHYALSMQIGERSLLSCVRKSDPATLLVAPGFSCRTQIHQATGRMPLHPAQLVDAAFSTHAHAMPGAR